MTDQAQSTLGVLEATPPAFTPFEVSDIARDLFGIDGTACDLGSERDQTFMIDTGAEGGGVLKISNLGEDPASLDIEVAAALHVATADPELPVARQIARLGAPDEPAFDDYRPTFAGPDGPHYVRLFQRMHGRAMVLGAELDDAATYDYGAITARLARAMRGFFHPAAGRHLLWDTKHALDLRPLVETIPEASRQQIIHRVLDQFEQQVAPRYPQLRAQVVHGDLALDNVLLDDRGRVAGIVDFGDMMHTGLVTDLAAAMASVWRGRDLDDRFRVGRIMMDGYQSVTPLEPLELEVYGDGAAGPARHHRHGQRLARAALSRERRVHPELGRGHLEDPRAPRLGRTRDRQPRAGRRRSAACPMPSWPTGAVPCSARRSRRRRTRGRCTWPPARGRGCSSPAGGGSWTATTTCPSSATAIRG